MIKPQQLLVLLFFMLTLMGCKVNRYSQETYRKIVVDAAIRDSLVNEVQLDTIGEHMLGRLFFHINETYAINDFKIPDASDVTYFLEVQQLLKKPFMETVCDCKLKGDTIIISGEQGYYAGGVGFKIFLFKDKSFGHVLLQTSKNVYQLKGEKGAYTNKVVLPLSKLKLVVQKQPAYVWNAEIYGKALLITEAFYQLNNTQEPKQIQLEFTIEFGCLVNN